MENPMAAQVQYGEYQRQTTWLNEEGWRFYPPTTRTPVRETVARTLVTLAARLAPAISVSQPRTT